MSCRICTKPIVKPDSCGTGYARCAAPFVGEFRACYQCVLEIERARMRGATRGARLFGYLSCDGRSVTNWPGGALARVVSERASRFWGFGGWHDRTHVRAIAPDGAAWSGWGIGRGCYVRLRRVTR